MIKFEILFETNNRANFLDFETLASELFDSFTVQETMGYWQGDKSPAYIFSLIGEKNQAPTVKYLARYIKAHFLQDAVLYTETVISSEII